mmetsp:Transcript_24650/g.24235  ORF Transcript_24650/g.24235 Transcript_24650/m.24235 type:complete len:99 (+) Transcript_24650:90-386(+)
MAWSFCTSFTYFFLLNKLNKLRISPIIEIIGMDEIMMERTAQPQEENQLTQRTIQQLDYMQRYKTGSQVEENNSATKKKYGIRIPEFNKATNLQGRID